MESLGYLSLLSVLVVINGLYLSPPYPPGSARWCFNSDTCSTEECCMLVWETDGPFGKRGVAPPGKCFQKQHLGELCIKPPPSKKAVARRCHTGSDCTDNQCCTTWVEQGPIVGREVFEGVCERLGHQNSECYPGDHANGTNGKPGGIVPSCPCNQPFTCISIGVGDHHGSLGVCS